MPDLHDFHCRLASNYDNMLIIGYEPREAAEIFGEYHHKKTGEGAFSVIVKHKETGKSKCFEVLVVNKPTYQVKEVGFGEIV